MPIPLHFARVPLIQRLVSHINEKNNLALIQNSKVLIIILQASTGPTDVRFYIDFYTCIIHVEVLYVMTIHSSLCDLDK